MSFLTKIRKVVHTTPVLRQVSQSFANAWGAGKAYSEFDAKIGYTEAGEATPASNAYAGFGREDLAGYLTERYPGASQMVQAYHQAQRAMPSYRQEPFAEYEGEDLEEEPYLDEEDYDYEEDYE